MASGFYIPKYGDSSSETEGAGTGKSSKSGFYVPSFSKYTYKDADKEEEERLKREQEEKKKQEDQNRKNVQQTVGDIVGGIGNFAKGVGEAIAEPFRRTGEGVAEVVNEITGGAAREREIQQQVSQQTLDIVRDLGKKMQEAKTEEEKNRYREGIKRVLKVDEEQLKRFQERQGQIIERADPVKGAAAIGELGLNVITGGTAGTAIKGAQGVSKATNVAQKLISPTGVRQGIASGAAQGALYGATGTALQQGSEADIGDYAAGVGTGAVFGGAIGGIVPAVANKIRNRKKIIGEDDKITEKNMQKVRSRVGETAEKLADPLLQSSPALRTKEFFTQAKTKFIRSEEPILQYLRKGERKGALDEGATRRVETLMRDVKTAEQQAEYFMRDNQNWTGVIQGLSNKGLKDMSKYAEARAELDLIKRGVKEDGGRAAKFEEVLAEAPADFTLRFDNLTNYYKDLRQRLVDGGLISKEQALQFEATDPSYVHVQREIENMSKRGSKGTGAGSGSLRSTKALQSRDGSTAQMKDLLQTAVGRTQELERELLRNKAATALIDELKKIDLADPARTAETVLERQSIMESLNLTKPLKKQFSKFAKTQSQYLGRIQRELDILNRQGLQASLEKEPGQVVAPRVKTITVKTVAPLIKDNAPKTLDGLKQSYLIKDALKKEYGGGKNAISQMAADIHNGGWSQLMSLNPNINRKTAESIAAQILKEPSVKPGYTEITEGYAGRAPSNKQLFESLLAQDTSKLKTIRKKIANREPKLAQAVDELTNIQKALDDINEQRSKEYREMLSLSDKKTTNMPTISRRVEGVDEVYTTLPEIEAAAKSWDSVPLGAIGRAMAFPTRVLRSTLTGPLNPAFLLKSAVRDPIESFTMSKNALATHNPVNVIGSLADAAGKSDLFKEYLRTEGSSTMTDVLRKPKNAARALREQARLTKPQLARKAQIIKNPVEWARKWEDVVKIQEQLGRYQNFRGTYNDAIKKGASKEAALMEARWAARNNMVDFYQTGDWSKIANALFPYFNASVQGGARIARSFKEKPVATSAKILAAIQIPTVLTTMYNLSDPRRAEIYMDMPEYERENNWIFVLPNTQKVDGRWEVIKIPKPAGVGNFSRPVEKMTASMYGHDPAGFMDFVQATISAGSPFDTSSGSGFVGSLLPQAIKPFVQDASNYDFFTGRQIVPDWLSESEPDPFSQQFENTSGTAKQIASWLDISPLRIEKFIKSTLGEGGQNALFGIDSALQTTGIDDSVGGRSPIESATRSFTTASGGVRQTEIRDAFSTALNDRSGISQQITAALEGGDEQEANRLANEFNTRLMQVNMMSDGEFATLTDSQKELLDKLKFPLKGGALSQRSIKSRLDDD